MSAFLAWLRANSTLTAAVAAFAFLLNIVQAVNGYRRRFERKKINVKLLHVLNLERDKDRFEKSIRRLNLHDGQKCVAITVKYNGPNSNAVVAVGYRLGDSGVLGRHAQEPPRELRDGYAESYLLPHQGNEPEVVTEVVVYFRHGPLGVKPCNWPRRFELWLWRQRLGRMLLTMIHQRSSETHVAAERDPQPPAGSGDDEQTE